MPYDVFISYARADGAKDARVIKRLFDEHDIAAYMDSENPPPLGSGLSERFAQYVAESRFFVPVLSKEYINSEWARREYEFARGAGKTVIPVVLGDQHLVPWLASDNTWFDTDRNIVVISHIEREGAVDQWKLVESIAPASTIIAETQAVAVKSTTEAIETLDKLVSTYGPRGLQSSHLMAHKAYLLRLAGRRSEAREVVEQIKLQPDHPLPIVHLALVTAARLRMDMRDYADARARLAEAAAVLSRQSAWKASDLQRRRFLSEVTRETARSLLDEAYSVVRDALVTCLALELAWSMYVEALALVTEEEDNLGHAWIHENLGSLATLYARHSATLPQVTAEPHFRQLDYPAVSRFRGDPRALLSRAYHHFDQAQRLFERERDPVNRLEGEAWTRYHRIQTDLAAHDRSPEACRQAIDKFLNVLQLFDGIIEGKGLTYAELFYLALAVNDTRATTFGREAVSILRESEKHDIVVDNIRTMATHLGGMEW